MRRIAVLLLLTIALCLGGCANNSQPTAWQTVLTTNDLIATTNQQVAQSVINANAAQLISDAQAKTILTEQAHIAQADKQLTAILAAGVSSAGSNAAQIDALLAQIKKSINNMIATGVLGVKNPQTQMTIETTVDAVTSLAGTLVTELQAAGVKL